MVTCPRLMAKQEFEYPEEWFTYMSLSFLPWKIEIKICTQVTMRIKYDKISENTLKTASWVQVS